MIYEIQKNKIIYKTSTKIKTRHIDTKHYNDQISILKMFSHEHYRF